MRTVCNINKSLANLPHVHQRSERIQSFLDDDPEGTLFVHVFSTLERGVIKQARNGPRSRTSSENDVLCVEQFGEVVGCPHWGRGVIYPVGTL